MAIVKKNKSLLKEQIEDNSLMKKLENDLYKGTNLKP